MGREFANQQPSSSIILQPDGSPASLWPPHRPKLFERLKSYGIACCAMVVCSFLAYGIWRLGGQRTTAPATTPPPPTSALKTAPPKQPLATQNQPGKEQPKQTLKKSHVPAQQPGISPQPAGVEQDGSEKLKISDGATTRVIRQPAITARVNHVRTIKVVDDIGAPLKGAQLMLVGTDGVHSDLAVSNDVGVANVLTSDEIKSVYCAADGFAAYLNQAYDPTTPLTVMLKRKSNGGSIIFDSSTGTIPGLSGRLNPIYDESKRTYLYAQNMAINGKEGGQPLFFDLHRPLTLKDKYGHIVQIEFIAIATDCSLIEFRRI